MTAAQLFIQRWDQIGNIIGRGTLSHADRRLWTQFSAQQIPSFTGHWSGLSKKTKEND
jgi:hypothetical protein